MSGIYKRIVIFLYNNLGQNDIYEQMYSMYKFIQGLTKMQTDLEMGYCTIWEVDL